MKLKSLPNVYERSSYLNTLVFRGTGKAIYEVSSEGRVHGYEVGKVRLKPYPFSKYGRKGETNYATKWRNEDFGVLAWYYKTKEEALRKYNELP